jgi:hypothetical protein
VGGIGLINSRCVIWVGHDGSGWRGWGVVWALFIVVPEYAVRWGAGADVCRKLLGVVGK